jgi:glycosyltransferase involved in cell wall biosynthesis
VIEDKAIYRSEMDSELLFFKVRGYNWGMWSVLIPYYRKEKSIKAVVHAILREEDQINEILIYCDGCKKPDLDHPKINYMEAKTNQGLVNARNQLIKNAKSENLLFLDADAVPCKNFFKTLNQAWNKKNIFTGQEFQSPRHNVVNAYRRYFWRQTFGDQPLVDCPHILGLCFGGPKRIFKQVGDFSSDFQNFGEDVEYGLRATFNGNKISYFPDLKVFHYRTDDFKSMLRMIKNHSESQVKAYILHKKRHDQLLMNALKWIYISIGSSLKTHKSIGLAFMAFILSSYAFMVKYNCISCLQGKNTNDS